MDSRRTCGPFFGTFVLMVVAGAAAAQESSTDALLTATQRFSGQFGFDETTTITCRGYPTCLGTYSTTARFENCSNYMTFGGEVTFTGLALGQSGPIQGTFRVSPSYSAQPTRFADGTCAPGQPDGNELADYTGTWDRQAATGTIRVTARPPFSDAFSLTFRVDLGATAPVFPLTVRANIGAQTSTAIADIRFRAQDVGRTGGVFAFASAPVNIVRGALATETAKLGAARIQSKADPPQCVLAQLNSSGQLVAVSLAQLQAFTQGAFAAAGTSVTILNNTPTPNIAGATFYVGYGATAQAMLNDGVFRSAVLIPGSATCPPLPYMTSLWWNPAESGWGLNINQQGSIVFATLFTYDATRAPLWLVMSGGALQPDGVTFLGDLYRTTGPAFNANPFTPIGPSNVTQMGTMSISFTEANAATLTYTVNGQAVTKQIQRQVYGSRAANCLPTTEDRARATSYQDLWWIASESGWGINITHQDNTLFATLFTYDAAGRGLWLVMPSGPRQADGSYFGDLFRTSGPAFNSIPFTPIGAADVTAVGTMRLRFTDGNSGTLAYTYLGTPVTKAITRQVFSTPQFACN